MKRSIFLATFLLCIFPLTRSQEPTRLANTASIAGIVTKEPGSEPLRKVLLQVISEDQTKGANYTATTDPDGRFRIENVQPGRYRLFLERTGFIQINEHNRKVDTTVLDVRARQDMNDLLLRMLPMAVIAGRVVDEDGDPLANFNVSVGKRKPGKTFGVDAASGERTNDRGEYRISGLFPGKYFLVVTPAPDFANLGHTAKSSPDDETKPETSYVTTYYPGTTDSVQASSVNLRAGDEMPINFTIVPTRTYRVRGLVTGLSATQKPMVQLITRGTNTLTLNAAEVKQDGQFEIRGVAPGSYWIASFSMSEGDSLAARQSVTVVAANVEGIKLVPARPFTITGHLRVDGGLPLGPGQYSVYLQNTEASEEDGGVSMSFASGGANPVARVDRLGNFRWTGVTPGRYVAQVNGGDVNTFFKSAALGTADATAGFKVNGTAAIDIVISTKGAVLEGVVLDKDRPVANCGVVAVPEEKYQTTRQHFGVGTTDQNGHFILHGLAPGSYTIFAWQDVDDDLYYDADFLKSQDGNGTALKIEEGGRYKSELKPSPVSEDWQ